MSITEQVLSHEGYVAIDPSKKDSVEFKIAHLIKEQIRTHKWNRGTEGVGLSWAAARQEWMQKYYRSWAAWLRPYRPKKKLRERLKRQKARLREPMVTGGLI